MDQRWSETVGSINLEYIRRNGTFFFDVSILSKRGPRFSNISRYKKAQWCSFLEIDEHFYVSAAEFIWWLGSYYPDLMNEQLVVWNSLLASGLGLLGGLQAAEQMHLGAQMHEGVQEPQQLPLPQQIIGAPITPIEIRNIPSPNLPRPELGDQHPEELLPERNEEPLDGLVNWLDGYVFPRDEHEIPTPAAVDELSMDFMEDDDTAWLLEDRDEQEMVGADPFAQDGEGPFWDNEDQFVQNGSELEYTDEEALRVPVPARVDTNTDPWTKAKNWAGTLTRPPKTCARDKNHEFDSFPPRKKSTKVDSHDANQLFLFYLPKFSNHFGWPYYELLRLFLGGKNGQALCASIVDDLITQGRYQVKEVTTCQKAIVQSYQVTPFHEMDILYAKDESLISMNKGITFLKCLRARSPDSYRRVFPPFTRCAEMNATLNQWIREHMFKRVEPHTRECFGVSLQSVCELLISLIIARKQALPVINDLPTLTCRISWDGRPKVEWAPVALFLVPIHEAFASQSPQSVIPLMAYVGEENREDFGRYFASYFTEFRNVKEVMVNRIRYGVRLIASPDLKALREASVPDNEARKYAFFIDLLLWMENNGTCRSSASQEDQHSEPPRKVQAILVPSPVSDLFSDNRAVRTGWQTFIQICCRALEEHSHQSPEIQQSAVRTDDNVDTTHTASASDESSVLSAEARASPSPSSQRFFTVPPRSCFPTRHNVDSPACSALGSPARTEISTLASECDTVVQTGPEQPDFHPSSPLPGTVAEDDAFRCSETISDDHLHSFLAQYPKKRAFQRICPFCACCSHQVNASLKNPSLSVWHVPLEFKTVFTFDEILYCIMHAGQRICEGALDDLVSAHSEAAEHLIAWFAAINKTTLQMQHHFDVSPLRSWGPVRLNFSTSASSYDGFHKSAFGMIAFKDCEVIVRTSPLWIEMLKAKGIKISPQLAQWWTELAQVWKIMLFTNEEINAAKRHDPGLSKIRTTFFNFAKFTTRLHPETEKWYYHIVFLHTPTLFVRYGSLQPVSNQGTECSNQWHQRVFQTVGQGALLNAGRTETTATMNLEAETVLLYIFRKLIYQIPELERKFRDSLKTP